MEEELILISAETFKLLTENKCAMTMMMLKTAKETVIETITEAINGKRGIGEVEDDERSVSLFFEEDGEVLVGEKGIKNLFYSNKFPMDEFKGWLKSSGWKLYIYAEENVVSIDIVTTTE